MIATAHLAAGGIAAVVAGYATRSRPGRLVVAVALGLGSHVLLDIIPHSDYAPFTPPAALRLALAEVAVAGVLLWWLLRRRLPEGPVEYVVAGIAAAVASDVKSVADLVLPASLAGPIRALAYRWHEGLHAAPPSTLAQGWGAEIAVSVLLLGVLALVPRRSADATLPRPAPPSEGQSR